MKKIISLGIVFILLAGATILAGIPGAIASYPIQPTSTPPNPEYMAFPAVRYLPAYTLQGSEQLPAITAESELNFLGRNFYQKSTSLDVSLTDLPRDSQAIPVQPTSTPAAPEYSGTSTIPYLPGFVQKAHGQAPTAMTEAELDLAKRNFYQKLFSKPGTYLEDSAVQEVSQVIPATVPQGVVCKQMLLNPQMDVVDFGDGTGAIDYWAVLWQNVYFDDRPGYYRSAKHSLVMVDDPDYDTDYISPTLDLDSFGQGFYAPTGLLTVTVTYSRLYSPTSYNDFAYGNFYTLDSEGRLDENPVWWTIGETPSGWSDRIVVINNPTVLASLSGRALALVFEEFASRSYPHEFIWLDDAQVTVCYQAAVYANNVYLPVTLRAFSTGPTCIPREPDSVTNRGSTVVGAVCNGSFGPTDMKDYYTLILGGVANVRLSLTNLPPGTNWDALIYEDTAGYPLACQIGTPGSADKYKDCTLDPNKSYFVMVSAGVAPASNQTYRMSVTAR